MAFATGNFRRLGWIGHGCMRGIGGPLMAPFGCGRARSRRSAAASYHLGLRRHRHKHKKLFALSRGKAGVRRRSATRESRERGVRMTLAAAGVSQRSSVNFVSDTLICGRCIPILAAVDDFTRGCLALVVDISTSGARAPNRMRLLLCVAAVARFSGPTGFDALLEDDIGALEIAIVDQRQPRDVHQFLPTTRADFGGRTEITADPKIGCTRPFYAQGVRHRVDISPCADRRSRLRAGNPRRRHTRPADWDCCRRSTGSRAPSTRP